MRIVWIDPNFFYLYPNSIQTGGVVQFCHRNLLQYYRGGLPELLPYYMRGVIKIDYNITRGVFPIYYNITMGGSLGTPNLYYVIYGQPLIISFQKMYGFGGSGAKRSEIWSGVTIAGRATEQTRKDRATQPMQWTMEG